ncbi:uncharacterized protein LOC132721232 [Ruditapes philippinarum]|uniref:uncharacterized protein LOC132721232 n=1 Tax=Ruditapes philippinarum TaxID=129788 RepID=UPI00295C1B24|nr:uncharacterized protein LOC132721232 [Ruditapes philippinarum]
MKVVFLLLVVGIQVVVCRIKPSDIVKEANRHINTTKWSVASNYGTGKGTNKCNQFVYDVLKKVGTDPPKRRWFIYSPIGAGEWGNPNSSYLKKKKCWENCKGSWRSGDVISDSVHVAIITDNKRTTSARHDKVVQNDWGFRSKGTGAKSSIKACWRYKYSC